MGTRKLGTGRRERDTDLIDEQQDESLVDDEPEDGFELIDEDAASPDERRRDPLRRP